MPFEAASLRPKSNPFEILEELQHSQQHTNVIGIFLKGKVTMITTAVVAVEPAANGDYLVRLEDCDLHGYPIGHNPIRLSDIDSVIHFNTLFKDPVYTRLRERRTVMGRTRAA